MKKILWMAALVLSLLVSACSGEGGETGGASNDPTGASEPGTAEPAAESNTDPLGKYDPPIVVSTVRSLNSSIKFAEGESIDNNIWYRGYKDDLGIEVKNEWSVPDTQFVQKLNVSVASGAIPDITPVDLAQLQKLVDADMIEELTSVYDDYASELTKSIIEGDGGNGLTAATFDGKIMAMPSTVSTLDGTSLIWIRKDWLDAVGLPEPKSLSDIQTIAKTFAEKKPSGHERTFGIAIEKNIFSGYAGIGGLAAGYGAYPEAWLENASGELVYGSIQPEMKEALGMLQEMFKAGLIDPEFGVQDANKVNEMVASGQVGLVYGQHWNAFWPLPDSFNNDNNADWTPYPLVSKDGGPAKSMLGNGPAVFYVAKKGMKHPEALIKLLNYNLEKQYGPNGRDMEFHGDNVIPAYMYAAVYAQHPQQNINIYRDVVKGFAADSGEGLSFDGKDNFESIKKYMNGDKAFWGSFKWSGPGGALSVEDYYDQQNLTVSNAFLGAPTATMLTKGTTLDTLELETFTKIIMNTVPLDEFDTFVENWKKLGGDEITKEVNDWASAK
ncbi:extracellular solute-binding protein [Paenibacillus sp.]|uniref:extracellular solute-binding protein n=1 Tax=Paenibacillus sp. TaxID=58172 RepID=UPI0028118E0E|nr:extracellular solute-binding protein [Paenibacillus sp.]